MELDGLAAASQTQVGFEVLWPFGRLSGGLGVPSQVLGSESASATVPVPVGPGVGPPGRDLLL